MTKVLSVDANGPKIFSAFKSTLSKSGSVNAQSADNAESKAKTAVSVVGMIGAAAVGSVAAYKIYSAKIVERLLKKAVKLDIPYIKSLADDMSAFLGKKISIENLSSVMGKNELIVHLKKMKPMNFAAYRSKVQPNQGVERLLDAGNIERGIFKIDIHSHTNFSDGLGSVENILNDAATYADKLYEKTGEKFIFSITDHDMIAGSKEALRLIAENPQKYKNLRFVPGVELSFAHTTDKGAPAVSEMLAYGINPYSVSMNGFIDNLLAKRKNMIEGSIRELHKALPNIGFDVNEMNGFFLNLDKDMFKYSLHYRVQNYAQIKQRMTGLANLWGKDPKAIYAEIMPQWHISQTAKCPDTFEQFLKDRSVDLSSTLKENELVSKICAHYYPKYTDNKIVAAGERTYSELIDMFKNENNVMLSLAHPAFFALHFKDSVKALNDIFANSKGILKSAEICHQAYDIPVQNGALTQDFVKKVNQVLRKLKLIPTGGHDNHQRQLLPF